MTIVCGTDFSAAADSACQVAVTLAAHHREPLTLLHALEPLAVPPMPGIGRFYEDIAASAEAAVAEQAARLRNSPVEVTGLVKFGHADEVILSAATETGARLIVLGSVGHRGPRWLLGSTAERVVARNETAVLVIRGDFPANQWLWQGKPLRVMMTAGPSPETDPVVQWARHLSQHGPCQFSIAHLGPSPMDRASSIVQMARQEHIDLLVVGRGHEEEPFHWDVSLPRAVVRQAPMSVVCIPPSRGRPRNGG